MKAKPGKHINATFTAEQEEARRMWRAAQRAENELSDGLLVTIGGLTRAEFHAALDRRLNHVERLRREARAAFPDVAASFTISTWTVN